MVAGIVRFGSSRLALTFTLSYRQQLAKFIKLSTCVEHITGRGVNYTGISRFWDIKKRQNTQWRHNRVIIIVGLWKRIYWFSVLCFLQLQLLSRAEATQGRKNNLKQRKHPVFSTPVRCILRLSAINLETVPNAGWLLLRKNSFSETCKRPARTAASGRIQL